jgi:hypothetical protein
LKRVHPGKPDASHLHQLIYRRIVRWTVGGNDGMLTTQRNAMTSPYLWVLSCFSVIPAVLFWRYHIVLKAFAILFAITYTWIYRGIARFRVPKWMRF